MFKSVCVCERERERDRKKINSFGITAIIFKALNFLFKKDFKSAELLTKISFFFYFRDIPKMTKEARRRREYKRKSN